MNYQINAVGSDMEVFLRDKNTKLPVPVCGLLGGTKEEPFPVLQHADKGFFVQEDNVMAEFNIPPSFDVEQFQEYMSLMRNYLRTHFAIKGLELDISPSVMFDASQLQTKQAQTFGCLPDYNVWNLEENDIDQFNPILKRMRTAGGHVHISFSINDEMPCLDEMFVVVKILDVFLGVPSVFLDPDIRRKKLYGKAGAFRVKQYAKDIAGIEYRVLSNFWFTSDTLVKYIYQQITMAFHWIRKNPNLEELLDNVHKDKILSAINDGNKEAAEEIMRLFGIYLPPVYNTSIETPKYPGIINAPYMIFNLAVSG